MPARKKTPPHANAPDPGSVLARAILPLFARQPISTEQKSRTPLDDARKKANAAAKAALAAGVLALPPGLRGACAAEGVESENRPQ
jgi:hypothetical protein